MAVEFTAIFCASLAKLGQDSIVQREIGDEIRSSTFAVSETLNQVANVAGGLVGVLVSMLNNGQIGLAIAAAGLTVALVMLIARRRQRVRATWQGAASPPGPGSRSYRTSYRAQGFRRGEAGRLDGRVGARQGPRASGEPIPAATATARDARRAGRALIA